MKNPTPLPESAKITLLIALAIGLAALALRLWGIKYGLPNVYCGVDEDVSLSLAMRYGKGDFSPDFFWWPRLHSYLLFMLYGAYYALGFLAGKFHSVFDFQKLYFTDPQSFYLIARVFSAFAGAFAAVLLFYLGKKFYSRRIGAMAALFLAFNFLHIRDSHYARPDILGGLLMVPAFMLMMSMKDKKDYLLMGVLGGLLAAVKYQFILILFPALVAHFIPGPSDEKEPFARRLFSPGPVIMVLAAFAVFFVTSPITVLNLGEILKKISSLSAKEHEYLMEYGLGNSFSFHFRFSFLQGVGLPLLIASLLGIAQSLARPQKSDIVLLSFAAAHYLVITLGGSSFMRYIIPMLFPMFLFAARFADSCIGAMDRAGFPKPLKAALAVLLLAALLYLPARKVFAYDRLMAAKDNRVAASEWIEANIPGGSRLAFASSWPLECPVLRESKESLAAAMKDTITGYRHKFLLELPDYPAAPAYYLSQLDDDAMRTILWYKRLGPDLKAIKAEKIDYLVEIAHYPTARPAISAKLRELIERNFTLHKEILPYSGDAPPGPLFDEPTGTYLPCAGFARMLRPGPIIRIWRPAYRSPAR